MLRPSREAYELIKGLRVVRRFRPQPVSDEELDAILEAGRWTGSSKNRQDWLFLVIGDRERLDRLATCGQFTTPIRHAPLVVAPIGLSTTYEWDLGRVSQNLMLAAAAVGVGSCPVTLHDQECARDVLGLSDGQSCGIVIALGHPDEESEREARGSNPLSGRRPLDDLVRYETL